MKKLALLLIITLLFTSCKDQKTSIKNDLILEKINGNVKTIIRSEYDVIEKFGEVEKNNQLDKRITHYNLQGNIIEEITSNDVIKYEYNKIGKLIEIKRYNIGKYHSKDTYEYDEKGVLVNVNKYNGEKEKFSFRYIYKYDKKNNLTKKSIYNPDGSLSSYSEFNQYNGNVIGIKTYDSTSFLKGIISYTYDQNNNRTGIAEFDKDSTYLSNGHYWEYDENNNTIKDSSYYMYQGYTSPSHYKYLYDKKNNWTSMIQYDGNKAVRQLERVINYY
jgi:YD repeat-containing protein